MEHSQTGAIKLSVKFWLGSKASFRAHALMNAKIRKSDN